MKTKTITGETAIELTRDGISYTGFDKFTTDIMLLAVAMNEKNLEEKMFPMRKGCVNFNKPDVIISVGYDIYNGGAYSEVRNVLTSLSWEETIKEIRKHIQQ